MPASLTVEITQIFNGLQVQRNLVADCRADCAAELVDAYNQHEDLVNFRDGAWQLLNDSRQALRQASQTLTDPVQAQALEKLAKSIDSLLAP